MVMPKPASGRDSGADPDSSYGGNSKIISWIQVLLVLCRNWAWGLFADHMVHQTQRQLHRLTQLEIYYAAYRPGIFSGMYSI